MPRTKAQIPLVRRGVRHGVLLPTCPASTAEDAVDRFAADRPILMRGALLPRFDAKLRASVAATRRMLERVRRGGALCAFVERALEGRKDFRRATCAVEMFDPREIEKVYADEVRVGRVVSRDLYAKLSWISTDARDVSLRIRFSFGSELLGDWTGDVARAEAADRYAEAVFPECAALTGNPPLVKTIERAAGRKLRFSERIVFSNAPGGGAVFHHDAEIGQLGVLYGQLQGKTAWLALPKRELAELLATFPVRGALARRLKTPAKALRALDDHDDAALETLLNSTPALTKAVAKRGGFVLLEEGDALVLPSHGKDDCCWHAVFAPGRTPSLAHSYGIFPAGLSARRAARVRAT